MTLSVRPSIPKQIELIAAVPAQERRTPSRVLLQRRAPETIRRHWLRSVTRIGILLAGDALAFLLLRAGIRAVRDGGAFGPAIASWAGRTVPLGFLGGWQFATALLIGLMIAGAYGRGDTRRDPGRIFRAVTLAVALALWDHLWVGPSSALLIQFSVVLLAVWSALSLERIAVDQVVRRVFPHRRGERVVFVGDESDIGAQRAHRRLGKGVDMAPLAWVHLGANGSSPPAAEVVDRIWEALERTGADTVVLFGEFAPLTFEAIVESSTSGGVRVLSASRNDGVARRRPGLVWYGGSAFTELTVPALKGPALVLKRALDMAVSGIGLVLLAPVFLVVAIAIKLDSRGPVFFSQERVGYAGRVFRVFKFRTMRDGADAEKATMAHLNHTGDSRLFKIPDDPRVTRLGAFLRKWSIDELPQLWNVFRGCMSLVGPRPFFETDLQTYLDHHFARLGAKPGITGLWQVKGRSAVSDFEEVVRLDREYIDRWSLLTDLRILAQTVPAVLRKTGAF